MAAVEGTRRRIDVGAATQELYRQYGKQIYAYCYHRLRSREEAEDAVQTTFMNAFRALQRGAETRFEQAWLFKIAQNVCIARSSSSARRLRLEAPNDFEVLQEIVPAQDGERPVELIGVEEALEAMPENQRRAILLREWQGLSYREIGEELGLSQAAVEMLIFRARRALAGALEQPDGKKERKLTRKVGSAGSLLGALKTLLGGGTAIKAAAVAAAGAIAVVGESAQHTIVRRVGAAPRVPAAAAATTTAGVTSAGRRVAGVAAAPVVEPSRVAVVGHALNGPRSAVAVRRPAPHLSAAPHARPELGEQTVAVPATTTVARPEPPPVTTAAAAPVAQPAPAQPAPAQPTPAQPAPAQPPAPPAPAATTTATPPPAPTQHEAGGAGEGRGKDGGPPIDRQVAQAPVVVTPPAAPAPTTTETTTTTTSATTTTTTPAPPAPGPPPWANGRGHDEHGHVPPLDAAQAATPTTTTTTTAATTTTPVPTPAPPMSPAPLAPIVLVGGPPQAAAEPGRRRRDGH